MEKTLYDTVIKSKEFDCAGWLSFKGAPQHIVLYILDAGVPRDMSKLLQLYCASFAGEFEYEGLGSAVFAEDFIKASKERILQDQIDQPALKIYLTELLKEFEGQSKKSVLAVTSQDMYPDKDWKFIEESILGNGGSKVLSFKHYF